LDGDEYLTTPLTAAEKHRLLEESNLLDDKNTGSKRLNLFDFMGMMRKLVRVGIQEIGYGYLPLAWASLTAYWLGFGMKELGLVLARLPDTLWLNSNDVAVAASGNLPSIVADDSVIHILQAVLIVGAVPISIGLTQKLCNDNRIGPIRLGLHAFVQIALALETLHLMLPSLSSPLPSPWN
jgi:hypothetical protein